MYCDTIWFEKRPSLLKNSIAEFTNEERRRKSLSMVPIRSILAAKYDISHLTKLISLVFQQAGSFVETHQQNGIITKNKQVDRRKLWLFIASYKCLSLLKNSIDEFSQNASWRLTFEMLRKISYSRCGSLRHRRSAAAEASDCS